MKVTEQSIERSRRFTRVRVAASRSSVDIAVPDDLPAADLVRVVVAEVGEDTDVPWVIEHPVRGPLSPLQTLGEVGCRDGDLLNLRSRSDVEAQQPVDEASEVVGADVDAAAHWDRAWLRAVASWGLVAWVGGAILLARSVAGGTQHAAVAAVGALVLAAMLVAGQGLERRSVLVVGIAMPLAVIDAVWAWLPQMTTAPRAAAALAAATFAAVAALTLVPAVRDAVLPPAVGVGVGAGLLAAFALLQRTSWTPAVQMSVLAVAVLLGVGQAAVWALGAAGVLRLDDESAAGQQVPRSRLLRSLASSRPVLAALLAGLSAGVGVIAYGLTRYGPWGVAAGVVLGFLVVVRARTFTNPWQVAALAFPAACGLGGAALWHAAAAPTNMLAPVTLLGAVPVAATWFGRLRQVEQSRASLWVDRLEKLGLIAFVPLLFGVCGTYAVVFDRFR